MPLRASSIHGVSIPCLVPLTTSGTRPPIILADSSIVIGSGDAAQIRLKSLSVSKAHALLLVDEGRAYVRDLASRTELFVNGAAVRDAVLKHGDVVRVGKFGFGVTEDPSVAAQGERPRPPAPVVLLRVADEAELRRVSEPVVLIGRRARCDISLSDDSLSGAHAVMFRIGRRWFLRDLASRTGTYVNGKPVRQQRALEDGDTIRAGRADIRFVGEERITGYVAEAAPAAAAAAAAAAPILSDVGPKASGVPSSTGNGMKQVAASAVERQAASAEVPAEAAEGVIEAGIGATAGGADVFVAQPVRPPADVRVRPLIPEPATGAAGAPVAFEPVHTPANEGRIVDPGVGVSESAASLLAPRPVAHEPRHGGGMLGAEDSILSGSGAAADESQPMTFTFQPVEEHPVDVHSATRDEGAETQGVLAASASDREWEENVAVWSFEELAQRGVEESDGDDDDAPRYRRALMWATVVGLVCAGLLGVLGYWLL